MPPDKSLLRAALRLRDLYLTRAADAAEQALLRHLTGYQDALQRCRAALRQAAIEDGTTTRLSALRCLHGLVQAVRAAVTQTGPELLPAARPDVELRSLVAELQQLDAEFGNLDIDLKNKSIHVTTEAIELDGVYLGPFTVQLHWPRLMKEASSQAFAVVAQQPNPAASNDAVTHPHVNHDKLCAGDATVPIQRALEQGRLADAFVLVRSVLTHYNPSSAHVPLDDWSGQSCFDCGGSTSPEDLSYCEACGHDYCEECISRCAACGESCCNSCLQQCPRCNEWCCSSCLIKRAPTGKICCRGCLKTCSACGRQVPQDELDPQTRWCPACLADAPASEPRPGPDADVPIMSDSPSTETVHELSNAIPAVA